MIETLYTEGGYLDRHPTWHVEDAAWKARWIAKALAQQAISPNRCFEIGCGAGEVLRQLSLLYPENKFEGYDVSPQAFRLAEPRATDRLTFTLGDAFELIRPGDYDTALAIDVFEHVEDYYGFLRRLKPLATIKVFHIPLDMSALAVALGNENFARRVTGHLHYYSKDSALATLEACGYEVLSWHFTDTFTLPFRNLHKGGQFARKLLKVIGLGLPRGALWLAYPALCARLLGGCSLLVVAR